MKPRIAVTMGDPGGIGPEIIAKALARRDVLEALTPLVIGDMKCLREAGVIANLPGIDKVVEDAEIDSNFLLGVPAIFQPYDRMEDFTPGSIAAANGKASYTYIKEAAELVLSGRADAICTAPISKEAVMLAGHDFPGHTEMLAHFCGRTTVRMMLVGGGLRVVLQTIHLALKDVPSRISQEGMLESLRMIQDFANSTGEKAPRIGICGLNPHCGEGGHFGREEMDIIGPAIQAARAEGIDAIGPVPGDTIFFRALQGEFNFVLAMYHDQALIPVKTLDFHGGVNVTVGLPLLRTSPDHGTAFNLAGQGIANESSMVAALLYAAELARHRKIKY